MSNTFHNVSTNIGALSNAAMPLFKVPAGYGGVTVIGGQCVQRTAGTTLLYLVEMDSTGATVAGTLGTFGTVYAVNTPQAATITGSRSFVDAGNYIGVKEGNVGAAAAITIVSFQFLNGKAEY